MKYTLPSTALSLAALICASTAYSTQAESILMEDVPHVMQKEDFCGEACVEMYLKKLGYSITQDDVFNASGVDPMEAR